MSTVNLELSPSGYLHLSAELVARYFPGHSLIALVRGGELWLLPVTDKSAGGLLLKQRNRAGDCSVLIWEVLPENTPAGPLEGRWDGSSGALRVALPQKVTP